MTLPPRWLRRLLGPVVLLGCLLVALVLLPVLAVVAAVASLWMEGRWRGLRLLAFFLLGLVVELGALIAAACMWVTSGLGSRLETQRYQLAHYQVLRGCLGVLVHSAQRLFRLRLVTDGVSWTPLDDGVPGSTNAMVVLARHAGAGDSLLLLDTLMNRDHLRRPRTVMKDTLQLDPVADTYFNRLPSRFIDPNPVDGDDIEATIATLAADLDAEDALLIFPEGGNFTPRRRTRAIARLRQRGHTSYAERADAMAHVMPPRPGGVHAALSAAPHADVVFVAHTGLEHIDGIRQAWRFVPQDKTLHLRWWFYQAADVPRDEEAQLAWLFERWADVDHWIDERQGTPGPPT